MEIRANCWIILTIWYFLFLSNLVLATNDSSVDFTKKEEIQTYFKLKRKQHLDAVKTLLNFQKYELKYEMMRKIFEKLFEVLETSRSKVENSDYVLGEELPKSDVIEPLLHVLDNCAFFGNLVLKLPDISEKLLNAENKWVDLYKWCFTFTLSSNLIDETSIKMFNLAAQQLDLIPKDNTFVNPYEINKNEQIERKASLRTSGKETNNAKKKKQTNRISKGPRMSRSEL